MSLICNSKEQEVLPTEIIISWLLPFRTQLSATESSEPSSFLPTRAMHSCNLPTAALANMQPCSKLF